MLDANYYFYNNCKLSNGHFISTLLLPFSSSSSSYPDKAPSLQQFAGTHLEADDYHKAMQDPNTVIIDVRNAYESAIGAFKPPEGGAKLIDPKMRNSIEFPKWLNSKETQQELNGKKVLMYWYVLTSIAYCYI